MIRYGQQHITDDDILAVEKVLRSSHLTQGPGVPTFEREVSAFVGAHYAVAVNSATSALHIACLSLGLGPGDVLWTSPNSFVASANCGLYCGANIDFVDIDPDSWNISFESLNEKLIEANSRNKLPKVLVTVHFSGNPTDQEKIYELVKSYGILLIEDASHGIGASFNGEMVGSCQWSDITIFSFHPVKIITSGEGGMAITNDLGVYEKLKLLRSHGISRDKNSFKGKDKRPWIYEQQSLGWNYRLTDIAAALGLSQLTRVKEYVIKRNQIAQEYNSRLKFLPLQCPKIENHTVSSFHLYVVRIDHKRFGYEGSQKVRDDLYSFLTTEMIGVNVHYIPIHLQPYYQNLGFYSGQFPQAEAYAESAITLPIHPMLKEEEQDFIIKKIEEFFNQK